LRIDLAFDGQDRATDVTRYADLAGTTKVATTSHTYDAAGNLTALIHRNGAGGNIANYTFTYDSQQRLTGENDNGTLKTYTYDNTNQLKTDGTNTITYDATGNRTNGSNVTGANNQLTSDGTWTYTYDLEGNLTKKSKGASAETWVYGYDNKNESVSTISPKTAWSKITLAWCFSPVLQ
jgi:YD repeat-containing protein